MLNVTDSPGSCGSDISAAVRAALQSSLPALYTAENEHGTALLESMISSRCLPHAVIIEGDNRECNSALARLLAQAHLCMCGEPLVGDCRTCRLFGEYGTHPDMYIIEGSGASGAVSVDSIRAAKKRGNIVPTDAEGTVYLLENAELMQKQAQNAFLKLFEEPPDGLMLILTCTSRMKLLETIRSRGTIIHFEWPPASEGSDDDTARQTAEKLASALCAQTDAELLFALAPFCGGSKGDGGNLRRQLDDALGALGELFRRALITSAGAESVLDCVSPAVRELASSVTAARLDGLIRELEPLRRALKNNASMPLLTSAITERLRRAAGR